MLLFTIFEEQQILKHHVAYQLLKEAKGAERMYINTMIEGAYIPTSKSPPSVLVVPGFEGNEQNERGIAASLKAVQPYIDEYDTIVVVGAYYPDSCGQQPPKQPIAPYYGDLVRTPLGDFDIDKELATKLLTMTEQKEPDKYSNELVEESDFFDEPFEWLRGMIPESNKKIKVLPVMLYATLRSEVEFSAQILQNLLFTPKEGAPYGVAADGKRYLVIIPIRVSEGLDLYENIYIENILLDLTFKNKAEEFEEWLYYLTGNTGATFSKTIASQVLVVLLSELAERAVPHKTETDPEWKWRVLEYYTTFDSKMNVKKMVESDYRSIDEFELEKTRKVFSDAEDSPKGEQIFYSMSLSLESPLHVSTTGKDKKEKVAKLPVPVASPEPFSAGAMNELMVAAQVSMEGKKYQKRENYEKYKSELTKPAPFSVRVYILADHTFEEKSIDIMKENGEFDKRQKDLINTCEEVVLFETKIVNFYPDQDILSSIIEETSKLHSERLSSAAMKKFSKQLKSKYEELVNEGLLPKSKMKDIDFNLKQNLIIELEVFHSWEYTELFKLTEAKGNFITLWDGRTAVCEVPDTRPGVPHIIFFRLTECALKAGLKPWDWQRANINTYDRTRLTKPVWEYVVKDEL